MRPSDYDATHKDLDDLLKNTEYLKTDVRGLLQDIRRTCGGRNHLGRTLDYVNRTLAIVMTQLDDAKKELEEVYLED